VRRGAIGAGEGRLAALAMAAPFAGRTEALLGDAPADDREPGDREV